MSDAVSILLFCLILAVPLALVVGLALFFSRKSARKRRTGRPVSSSDSMIDISRSID